MMEFFKVIAALALSLVTVLTIAGFGFYVFEQILYGEDDEFEKWPVLALVLIWLILAYKVYCTTY